MDRVEVFVSMNFGGGVRGSFALAPAFNQS